ncbi:MAG: ribonuclease P protein component [Candidatus Pacebacteria bacterium]|nr:ribonuclease P protein component [Candidatus Paceibacterota bacterium]
MISRKYRASRIDIERAIKTGFSVNGDFLYAKVLEKGVEKLGFSIIISKKVEKTSVGRHHIKRLISSIIEEKIKENSFFSNKIVVFFVKKAEKIDFSVKIRKDTEKILSKIFA